MADETDIAETIRRANQLEIDRKSAEDRRSDLAQQREEYRAEVERSNSAFTERLDLVVEKFNAGLKCSKIKVGPAPHTERSYLYGSRSLDLQFDVMTKPTVIRQGRVISIGSLVCELSGWSRGMYFLLLERSDNSSDKWLTCEIDEHAPTYRRPTRSGVALRTIEDVLETIKTTVKHPHIARVWDFTDPDFTPMLDVLLT